MVQTRTVSLSRGRLNLINMTELRNNKGYRLGFWLQRQWWTIKYFINGEMRRDKRQRKAWAKLTMEIRKKQIADEMREAQEYGLKEQVEKMVQHGYLQESSYRPYKDCMTDEHYDLIMRNRVVELNIEDRTIYEVNTKGLDGWEIDEFWAMLKDKCKSSRVHPIIREVISDRFPQ